MDISCDPILPRTPLPLLYVLQGCLGAATAEDVGAGVLGFWGLIAFPIGYRWRHQLGRALHHAREDVYAAERDGRSHLCAEPSQH